MTMLSKFPQQPMSCRAALPPEARNAILHLLCFSVLAAGSAHAANPPLRPASAPPVVFEKNEGQAPKKVNWIARGVGYTLAFADDGLTMMMTRSPASTEISSHIAPKPQLLHFALEGGRPWTNIAGLEPTGGVSNYLVPGNSAASHNAIKHYARLRVPEVYPGIDLIFYNASGNLEFDFVLRPGAEPQRIHVAFQGQRDLRVDDGSRDLVLTTKMGTELRQRRF
jgi:hypothetical protein